MHTNPARHLAGTANAKSEPQPMKHVPDSSRHAGRFNQGETVRRVGDSVHRGDQDGPSTTLPAKARERRSFEKFPKSSIIVPAYHRELADSHEQRFYLRCFPEP
jgi:hypothetical protein